MEIRGITPEQLSNVVFRVSRERYDGNVVCEWERNRYHREPSVKWMRGGVPSFRGRIVVESSRGSGARRSWSGRRMPVACWHVFRDVFRQAFQEYPSARFATSLARYTAENFETTYPATGYVNAGSMYQPVRLVDLCECGGQSAEVPDMPYAVRTATTYNAPLPRPSVSDDTDDARELLDRIDAALSVEPGICPVCKGETGSEAMVWDSQACQEAWQERYALSPSA